LAAQLIEELLADGFELVDHVKGTKVMQRSGLDGDARAVIDADQQ
jgi:hypothetical protein